MHDVFISYSHKDAQVADAICHSLEEAGVRCWYAPRNIAPGDQWADAIIRALETCEVMVLVFSDYSNASQQVYREVDQAVSLGKAIIPFKCTPSDPTGSLRYYLSTLHWLDAVDAPLEKSLAELCERVQGLLGKTSENGQGTGDDSGGSGGDDGGDNNGDNGSGGGFLDKRRIMVIAGSCAVVLVIVVVALMGGGSGGNGNSENSSSAAVPTEQGQTDEAASVSNATKVVVETESAGTKNDSGEGASAPAATSQTTTSVSQGDAGDTDSPDNYLYTVVSSGAGVRLDRYFGPEAQTIVLPKEIEGVPVTRIGEKCFEDHDYMQEVVLPDTITALEYRCFYGCRQLKTINIPEGLQSTGGWVFAHTGFESMTFPEGFESLGYGTFYGCSHLAQVELPQKVTKISTDTFRQSGKLRRVVIPSPEIEIASDAFDPDTDVTLVGASGSYTEKYAKGMGLQFEAVS